MPGNRTRGISGMGFPFWCFVLIDIRGGHFYFAERGQCILLVGVNAALPSGVKRTWLFHHISIYIYGLMVKVVEISDNDPLSPRA